MMENFNGEELFSQSPQPIMRKVKVIQIPVNNEIIQILKSEEIIQRTPQSGYVTNEVFTPLILNDGLMAQHISQILGACSKCGNLVSTLAPRVCECGRLLCFKCSKYSKREDRFYCKKHYRLKQLKKMSGFIGRLLVSPFIERKH